MGKIITEVKEEKDIGVTVDYQLNFESHITNKVRKAHQMAGMIRRTFRHLNHHMFTRLYKVLVRSQLDYASSVWAPHSLKLVDLIEGVQRKATKQLPGLSNCSYPERLKKLKLPSLSYRRLRGDMIEVYKVLSGNYDPKAGEILKKHDKFTTRAGTRGNSQKLFVQTVKTSIKKHSFGVRSTKPWNSLPNRVIQSKSVNTFKNRLDRCWNKQDILYNYRTELQYRNPETGTETSLNLQSEDSDEEA